MNRHHFNLALHSLRALTTQIDYVGYGNLIQHFSNCRLPLQGKQLHSRLVLSSVTAENFLASKLITFYAKSADDISTARKVFDHILHPNVFSYNALLIAYTSHYRHKEVLRLFSSLVAHASANDGPDEYSVTCLLKSLSDSQLRDSRVAKEVHLYVLKNNLDHDVVVGNALISYYSKCNELLTARKVFDKMCNRDYVSWNAMISGYSHAGFYKECKECYREMVNSSTFQPGAATVVSVLQACGQSKDLAVGMDVHKFVLDHKLNRDILVGNALISVYAKCGSLEQGYELFKGMTVKDEVSYNIMISSHMDHGYVEIALDIFGKMETRVLGTWNAVLSGLVQNHRHETVFPMLKEMQDVGFTPNSVTIASILPTMAHYGHLKGGKEIHAYALKNDCFRNVYVATGIIDTYAKSGYLSGGRRVFDQLKEKSVMFWTAMISAYSAYGDAISALDLFHGMLGMGIQPDSVTFVSVLASCAHCGMVDQALSIFNKMPSRYGVRPSMEHYACVVDALGKAGRLSEAKGLISKLVVKPNPKIWGALLNGASLSGDIEMGELAFHHLLEIEPLNTANHVAMINLYSQANKWKEADRVRNMMIDIGHSKSPGCSWTPQLSSSSP